MGGFNWKSPARNGPECLLCLSGGKSEFYLGSGVRVGGLLGLVRWQHKVSLRFHSCGWLLGVSGARCREHSASKIHPYPHLYPEQICWKSSGSGNKGDLLYRCWFFFQGVSSASQRKINMGRAPVIFHCPGRWRFWQRLVLEDGLHTGPRSPFKRLRSPQFHPSPSPSYPELW